MKTAIITGASTGMGRIFAKEISRCYKNIEEVWVIARNGSKLEELKRELLEGNMAERVFTLPLDLSQEEDLKKYEECLIGKKPDVCILVNSAGFGKMGTFEEISYEDNKGMVRLNCQALTEITYLTLPYVRCGGQVIQMASSAAFVPQPEFAVYAATKSYVLSFSRALKRELAPKKISVTAVCPGPVKTEFFHVAAKDGGKQMKWFKKLFMADPEKVVKKAIKDGRKGKEKSVYGVMMQLFEVLCKITPHSILLKIMS